MKVATYNVNGVNGRLPRLLEWLEETSPDIVCLQELKAPDEKFPIEAIRQPGRGRLARSEELERCGLLARGEEPQEDRRGLSGDPDDTR